MSNWVLDLSIYDLKRVWIRGEANILGDAPSRNPVENAIAKNLPLPDMEIREFIRKMYMTPEDLELMTKGKATKLGLEVGDLPPVERRVARLALAHHQPVRSRDGAARAEQREAWGPVAHEERDEHRHQAEEERQDREDEVDEVERPAHVGRVDNVGHGADGACGDESGLDADRLVAPAAGGTNGGRHYTFGRGVRV